MSASQQDAQAYRVMGTLMNRMPIFALLAAGIFSQLGNVLTFIAIPWLVLQTTGSASKTGIAGFVIALPIVLAGTFGGVLVDRIGFKRVTVMADLASGLTAAMIPLLHFTIGLEFWQLLILAFIGSLLDAPGGIARTSLYPELTRLSGMRLERANAIDQAGGRLAFMIGPPLAGVLIVMIGTENVLWIAAGAFATAAAVVIVAIPTAVRGDVDTSPEIGYLADLVAGFQQLRSDNLLLWLAMYAAVLNFFDAMRVVIYPVYADRVYGSAFDLGLILGASGGGALLSVLVFSVVGHRLPRRQTLIGGFIVASLPLWFFVLTPPVYVLAAAVLVGAFAAAPINVIAVTVFQERTPAQLRGRVFGLLIAVSWVASPMGRLAAGYFVEGVGLIPALVAISAASIVIATSMLGVPAFHQLNRAPINKPPVDVA